MAKADAELNIAQNFNPDLSFANPQAVHELKNRIAASHHINQSSNNSFLTTAEALH